MTTTTPAKLEALEALLESIERQLDGLRTGTDASLDGVRAQLFQVRASIDDLATREDNADTNGERWIPSDRALDELGISKGKLYALRRQGGPWRDVIRKVHGIRRLQVEMIGLRALLQAQDRRAA